MTTEGSNPLLFENTQLRQELELLRNQHQQELELLRAERELLLEQRSKNERQIERLQQQLQQLLRKMFGRKAEKLDPNQLLLFDKLMEQLAPPAPVSIPERPSAENTDAESSRSTNGHGRRRLPADLPRKKVIHDLPEEEKPCPCCGKMRHVIGQESSEQLNYVPAKLSVIEHVRLKYACPACEANASEAGPQITTAEKPLQPIEKGLAAPGLLAYVMVSKYGDHLPMHRLEGILQRHGIEIARSTMCDWAAQCAEVLDPLYRRMIELVRGSEVIHTDDTPVKVQDRTRDKTRTGRFWVYVGDPYHPYIVFDYTPNRNRDGPMQFLANWSGHLQADAFGGYDGIYAGQAGGQVTEVACWAHARRKFYEAGKSNPAVSTQALAYIQLLNDLEKQAKKVALQTGLDPASNAFYGCLVAERFRLRQQFAVPRLAQFHTWLVNQQIDHGGSVLPRSPMGEAITYALNQWAALCVYTTDGRLSIDNNASENALRRVALGRKNWLFCGSDAGGHTAAVLFSLIATCQRHQLDPLAYLRDVLTRIAATPISQLDQLLPHRWKHTAAESN